MILLPTWRVAEVGAQSTRAELLQAIRAQKVDEIAAGRVALEGSGKLERIASYEPVEASRRTRS